MPGTWASPFSAGSIWNTPLGADQSGWIAAGIGARATVRADENVLVATGTPIPVWKNNVGWSGVASANEHARERTDAGVAGASAGYSVPWPNAFLLPGGDFTGDTPNFAAAVLLADGHTIRNFQPPTHGSTTGSPPSSSPRNVITVYDDAPPNDDIVVGDGRFGAHGGSGLSSLGGCIRIGELTTANTGLGLGHALKFEAWAEFDYSLSSGPDGGVGFRWPAVQSDTGGPGGSVPACMYGSLLALKNSFNVAALNTEPARIIARTLKTHGAYIVGAAPRRRYRCGRAVAPRCVYDTG